jgi:uncharacterized membrane protein YdbT with pleckstrin-like domain
MARRKLRGIQFDSPDEREVFHAKESWVPLVLGAIPYLLVGIVGFVVASTLLLNPLVGGIILFVAIVLALVTRIPQMVANLDTDVIVTDKRLYARTGIIDIKDQVTDLANVSDVTVDPTVFGRIFDYADVTIQTYAGESDFVLKRIAHPYDMRSAISRGSDSSRSHDHPHNVRR